ncbi:MULTISPECIES: sensor histidine kinase [Fusobacterium]|jgi:two-component system phosphate regulon sensor histidine kinase PhoR|uniref:sensor histidine kinase n=1 Tax=Fusobacterium TaxID=848 RepID=UPI0008A14AB9|nr:MULTISPECIES: ATP-binding protein [Fusobacterium]MCF0170858.1 HAMP domain-containing protein [Fusobacterium varium]MCI6032935.1 ATP-binding protein [Fusobacterium varium]OFL85899.1 histidine kinase [Fusobacterium sp. HMSC073F01]RGJ31978.1 HAMP domain-containing protein [Fusobacterium varium]RHG38788.1 HAMP domain-containing protein [Fusobacterium varium]
MKKKFLLICFSLILTSTLIVGLIFNQMIRNNYIQSIFLNGISNSKLISVFLSENKNAHLYLYKLSQSFSKRTDFRVTFIDENGTPIADSNDNSIIFTTLKDVAEFQRAKKGIISYRVIKNIPKKIQTIEIFTSATILNGNPIIIMLSKDLVLFDAFKKETILIISLGITLSGILSIILSIYFINRATKPIDLLIKATKDTAKGNFSNSILIESHDEIEELAENFNYMNFKINTLLKDIQKKADNLQAIIDNLHEGIIVIDYLGKIILINNFAVKEFQLKSKYPDIFLYPELEFLNEYIRKSLANKKAFSGKITQNKNIYHIKTNFMKDGSEQVIIIIQNITKLELAEELRKEFVSNASHELKTPITIIGGFIETIKLGHFKDRKQLEYFIDIIYRETQRLNHLINDLLQLSHIENSSKSQKNIHTISLPNTFNTIISLYKNIAIKKDIVINTNIENVSIVSYISEEWLRTVIGNLIDNAIKYSKPSTSVNVIASIKNLKLIISIEDFGCGIEKNELKKIFHRFYRVDKSRNNKIEGTGLGLSIVKNMILNMKGKIKVKSEINKGSTFVITLNILDIK